jgi:hypothetical protein
VIFEPWCQCQLVTSETAFGTSIAGFVGLIVVVLTIDLSVVSLMEGEASLSAFARLFTLSISEGGAASINDAVPAGMVFAPMLVLSTKRTLIESKQISPNQSVLDIRKNRSHKDCQQPLHFRR